MPKQIVICYVMDALRADHLGCYGYHKPTSPFIDRLAEGGLVFNQIYSQSTETKSSAATILTSVYPSIHMTHSYSAVLSEGLIRLPEVLGLSGYETAAFNTNFRISAEYGFGKGFDHYFDLHKGGQFDDTVNLPSSEEITKQVISWLDGTNADKIFLWIWSMDTHIPYAPPKPFASRFIPELETMPDGTANAIFCAETAADYDRLVSLYDAEIARNDQTIEQLATALDDRGLWKNTTFILTADHGEMFLEHGHFMIHGGVPYQEVTHVPLVIKSPGRAPGQIDAPGGLIDLMPTVLNLAGIEPPQPFQGRDLLNADAADFQLVESFQENGGRSFAVFDSQWKLIKTDGLFRYQVWGRLKNKVLKRTKAREMAQFKKEVINTGIDPSLIKRALFNRLKTDFYGNPPAFSLKKWGLAWLKRFLGYFLGTQRLELYNRDADPMERTNVSAGHPAEVNRLSKALMRLQAANQDFKKTLSLNQRQLNADDQDLKERLKALGYIE